LVRLDVDLGPEFVPGENGASAILSPDGRRLVYLGRESGGPTRLYTRTLEQEQAAPIPGTEGASAPFFSPDGQFTGFFAGGKLKKVPVQGGVIVLCDAPRGVGGSWGDDGNIIAALNGNSALSRIPSGGGRPQAVTELKEEYTHRWPQVLPGARAVLFTVHTTGLDFDAATIEVQSLDSGQRKTLVREGSYGRYFTSGHLLFVRQSVLHAAPMDAERLELTGPARPVVQDVASQFYGGGAEFDAGGGTLLYVKRRPSRETLAWLESTGPARPFRALGRGIFGVPRFSPDGKRLALGIVEAGNTDIWVYEWARDAMTRLTFTPGFDTWPVWSPDGKYLVFSSRRHGGAQNLYWMRADGAGEAVRLTESKRAQWPSSFSPDGRRLTFTEIDPASSYDVWTLPLEGVESGRPKAGKAEVLVATPYAEGSPMVSPDGKWVAYRSDESGRLEVYVRRFGAPGGKWQISTTGGEAPIWSRAGKELFYRSAEGMMAVSYTANGEAFAAGKPRRWSEAKELSVAFDLAPNGRRFALVQEASADERGTTRVVFVLNFFPELR
jgi:serine/threonine-protein kinase